MADELSNASSDARELTRREAVKKAAIAGGALVWAAPVVQSIGMTPALAQQPTPTCTCSGSHSFDARLTLAGLIDGVVGPIMNFPPDGNDCLVGPLSLTAPGQSAPFLTAAVDCVGGSQTSESCGAFVTLSDLRIDLRNVNPAFDVQVNASLVESRAGCGCPGCNARTCVIAGGNPIVVAGGVPVVPDPGTQLCNAELTIPVLGLGTVQLLFTETSPCRGTFLKIDLALPANLQTLELVVARATAICG